ncbi:transketolase [Mycobacteroides abscessus]|nr:transketolase [Mycobacteroides abscessus]
MGPVTAISRELAEIPTDIPTLTRADHPDDWTELDSRAVDTVRVLAADAVQKVGNGHPGTAMSLAPVAYTLFQRQLRPIPVTPPGSAATGSCCPAGTAA